MPELESIDVNLSLPFGVGGITGKWKPDQAERQAAWEMYVELITRISVAELHPNEGLLREGLSSLYALFGITRTILREHGAGVAQPKEEGQVSFGRLAVAILNGVLRPFLSRWHPLLSDHENRRNPRDSQLEHEAQWDRNQDLREDLSNVRQVLTEYAGILANVAGVPLLTDES